jgi:hypothetical protein
MAAYTFEGDRVLKVRQQFTDEGQNHAVPSLVEVRLFRPQGIGVVSVAAER